jgi:hypothetical protein
MRSKPYNRSKIQSYPIRVTVLQDNSYVTVNPGGAAFIGRGIKMRQRFARRPGMVDACRGSEMVGFDLWTVEEAVL